MSWPPGVVGEVVARTATKNERLLAVGRAGMTSLSLIRSLMFWATTGPGASGYMLVDGATVVTAVLYSLWILRRTRVRPVSPTLLYGSTVVDFVVVVVALATNLALHMDSYQGILDMPDTAMILVIVLAAGLRLSPVAAMLAGLLNGLGLLALAGLDYALNPLPQVDLGVHLTMYLLLILATSAAATVTAHKTLTLAMESASAALEAERAEQNMRLLLRDHHDLRTLLSSATLRADMLKEQADEGLDQRTATGDITALQAELQRLNRTIRQIQPRTYEEIEALTMHQPVDLKTLLELVVKEVRRRFRDVSISVDAPAGVWDLVAGGPKALESAMRSVLVNACEGSGETKASAVVIQTLDGVKEVKILLQDDGPGFRPEILRGFGRDGQSTKANGGGYGLKLAWTVVNSSHGRLHIENVRGGGARVILTLPGADQAQPVQRSAPEPRTT